MFPPGICQLTGTPIRAALAPQMTRSEARKAAGIPDDAFLILALGGSQGARALNAVMLEAADQLHGIQLVHQAGAAHVDEVSARVAARPGLQERYRSVGFLDAAQLGIMYRAADLVVTRCGSTLAEVTANGLPAILAPLPESAGDHQRANARSLAEAGGGIVMESSAMTGASLAAAILGLAADRERLRDMAAASAKAGRPAAADAVAQLVLSTCRRPAARAAM